jgi:PD-(D/E)XK nuclease superfamily domain
MVLPALEQGGYTYKTQVNIGQRLGCGQHLVDVVAEKDDRRILISVKWQQVSGTAEQKVPFEIICLLEALESGDYRKAFLVLGGEGWTLREVYVGETLKKYLQYADKVEVTTLESFVAKANAGKL